MMQHILAAIPNRFEAAMLGYFFGIATTLVAVAIAIPRAWASALKRGDR